MMGMVVLVFFLWRLLIATLNPYLFVQMVQEAAAVLLEIHGTDHVHFTFQLFHAIGTWRFFIAYLKADLLDELLAQIDGCIVFSMKEMSKRDIEEEGDGEVALRWGSTIYSLVHFLVRCGIIVWSLVFNLAPYLDGCIEFSVLKQAYTHIDNANFKHLLQIAHCQILMGCIEFCHHPTFSCVGVYDLFRLWSRSLFSGIYHQRRHRIGLIGFALNILVLNLRFHILFQASAC